MVSALIRKNIRKRARKTPLKLCHFSLTDSCQSVQSLQAKNFPLTVRHYLQYSNIIRHNDTLGNSDLDHFYNCGQNLSGHLEISQSNS